MRWKWYAAAAAEWNGTIFFSLQNALYLSSGTHEYITYRYFFCCYFFFLLLFFYSPFLVEQTNEREIEWEREATVTAAAAAQPLFPLFLSNILLLPSSSSSRMCMYIVHYIKESLSAYYMHVLYPVSESEIITRYFIWVLAALPIKEKRSRIFVVSFRFFLSFIFFNSFTLIPNYFLWWLLHSKPSLLTHTHTHARKSAYTRTHIRI